MFYFSIIIIIFIIIITIIIICFLYIITVKEHYNFKEQYHRHAEAFFWKELYSCSRYKSAYSH